MNTPKLRPILAAVLAVYVTTALAQAPATREAPPKAQPAQSKKEAAAATREAPAEKAGKADKLTRSDRKALEQLAMIDMAEIEAGKLGAEKASNPEVKKFADHMAKQHTEMLEAGRKVADAKGVKFPAETDRKHQAMLKKLEGASGADFDKKFMDAMVKGHEDALKLAQKTADDAKDPDVKAHAEKGAPHIKEHLAMAKQVNEGLKGKPTSSRATDSRTAQAPATSSGDKGTGTAGGAPMKKEAK